MITRIWRGATRARDADAYLEYLKQTGLKAYGDTAGNLGVECLRRVVEGRAEFVVVSFWASGDALRAFAGEDADRAVFYPEDDRFLVDRDLQVTHYDVVFRAGREAAPAGP